MPIISPAHPAVNRAVFTKIKEYVILFLTILVRKRGKNGQSKHIDKKGFTRSQRHRHSVDDLSSLLFGSRPFAGYTVSFAPFSQDFTVSLSYFSKICVGIFAFISGYGLYLSFSKQPNTAKSASAWTVSRTIKTMSGYWFIYILALISTWIYADLPIKTTAPMEIYAVPFMRFLIFLDWQAFSKRQH